MKIRSFVYLFLATLLPLMTSCGDQSEDNTPQTSSDTELTSLSFSSNSGSLGKAKFTIDLSADTALVYNVDSLDYGTRIDSVVATFYFKKTIGYAVFYSDTDSVMLTAGDTLNFTPRPCRLFVMSSDYTASRWYHILVNVHQVDPELYVWQRMADLPISGSTDLQVVSRGGELCLFMQDGWGARVARRSGLMWQTPQAVSGLPSDAAVRTIVCHEGVFYYAEEGVVYTSSDAVNWSGLSLSSPFVPQRTLAAYNDLVWLVGEEGGKRCLAYIQEGAIVVCETLGELPERFPVQDYAVCTFTGVTGRPRLMIVGGYTEKGEALNTRWNVEYRADGRYAMEDFTIEQPTFAPLVGASIIAYDNRLFMFGGVDADMQVGAYPMLESFDEGLHWSVPDTAHNMLPATYLPRQHQAVTVDESKMIYLVGGRNRTTTFTDAYQGHRNDINW